MSKSFRPVVETWGSPTGFTVDSDEVEDILTFISYEATPKGFLETHDYGEVRSIWISEGREFIDYIMKATLEELFEDCHVDLLEHDESSSTRRGAIEDIQDAAYGWLKHLHPDGSLRLYIDQY